MENTRSIPYNIEAEKYVLGSVFFDNTIISSLVGRLVETDFYDERNRRLYEAMIKLYANNRKIESITVFEELEHLKVNVNEDLKRYVLDIIDSVPTVSTTDLYIKIVEEKALERRLLSDMKDISDDIMFNKISFNEILDKTEDRVLDVIKKRKTNDIISISTASEKVYQQIEGYTSRHDKITGISTGFPKLNEITLGFQKGDLMILAARPSVGKSTYAINLALNMCRENNAHVAFFSLEMSIEQLMMRVYSQQAEVELSNIRSGALKADDMLLLGLARQELSKLNLYFDESSSSKLSDIRAKCRQLKNEGKLDMVIIDYLQLITSTSNRGNRQEEVSQISRSLKTLARDLDVPILALSQLSRSIEAREDKVPQLADLRESGSIEQDADLVMFIFRRSDVEGNLDEEENRPKEHSQNKVQQLVLSIAKNRQGPLGMIDYQFYGHYCRFVEQKVFQKLIRPTKRRGLKKTIE